MDIIQNNPQMSQITQITPKNLPAPNAGTRAKICVICLHRTQVRVWKKSRSKREGHKIWGKREAEN